MSPRRRPSTTRPGRPAWALWRSRRRLPRVLDGRVRRGEEGFTLLEMIISIVIITIIMSALTSVYVNTLSSMSSLRADQAAAQISTDAIDQARAAGAVEAIAGRSATAVASQFAAAPAAVQPWLATMDQASDSQAAAGAGANATLPTTAATQVLNNVSYAVNYYVGTCYRVRSVTSNDNPCVTAAVSATDTAHSYVRYTRVVVAVTWAGQRCTGGACSNVAAVLLNGDPDPVFNLNTTPPPPPKLTGCTSQKSAAKDVFDTVNPPTQPGAFFLETAATSTGEVGLCTLTDGVPPFTFALTDSAGHPLPQGLSLGITGIISGTVAGPPMTYSGITITVTDAFLRQAISNTFSWQVVGPLVIGPVADQVGVVGTPITPLTLTATGGFGPPYTWSATGLPAGVALDAATGALSGTPTKAGVNHVTVTVKDNDATRSRTASVAFIWTVYDPLAITFGNQANSVNDHVDRPVGVSGGSGTYTLTATGLPGGLSLVGDSSSGYRVTGTVTGGGAYPVTLTATDAVAAVPPVTVNPEWVVADGGPIIADPGDQTNRVGDTVSLPIAAACGPHTPCAWSGSGTLPPGITFNASTGTFVGKPTTPGTYPGITVGYTDSATDAGGKPAPQTASVMFTWTITPALTMAIGNQRTTVNTPAANVTPTVTGALTGATYTYSASTVLAGADGAVANGLPAGLSIDASSGTISGTPTAAGVYSVTVTATSPTDSPATTTFTWYVLGLKAIPGQSCYISASSGTKCGGSASNWSQSVSNLSQFAFGATSSAQYSATITGKNTSAIVSSGKLTLTAPIAGTYTVAVSVTDNGDNAPSATAQTSFVWTITGWSGSISSVAYPKRSLRYNDGYSNGNVSLSSTATTWSMTGDGTITTVSGGTTLCLTDAVSGNTPTAQPCTSGNSSQQWSVDTNGRVKSGINRYLTAGKSDGSYYVTMTSSSSGNTTQWTLSP